MRCLNHQGHEDKFISKGFYVSLAMGLLSDFVEFSGFYYQTSSSCLRIGSIRGKHWKKAFPTSMRFVLNKKNVSV